MHVIETFPVVPSYIFSPLSTVKMLGHIHTPIPASTNPFQRSFIIQRYSEEYCTSHIFKECQSIKSPYSPLLKKKNFFFLLCHLRNRAGGICLEKNPLLKKTLGSII
ncbi:hypothetical protein H1C71_015924 [Ictidomys tridecemlineatus]|nr:hypothetical protein H1C71_015924 [Ictidomys tridecemlineatus]